MNCKTWAIALLSLFSLLAAPVAMPIATAKPTSCSNTVTQTWSPTANPNVVVTVTVAACVVNSNGSTFGVNSVTSGANSATIQPGAADYYFEGQTANCVFHTQCKGNNIYFHDHMTSGKFPNDSATFGPFSSSNPLECAVTNVQSFAVVYQPTGESHSFSNVFVQYGTCI